MKNFEEEYLQTPEIPHGTDPYLYMTPEVK